MKAEWEYANELVAETEPRLQELAARLAAETPGLTAEAAAEGIMTRLMYAYKGRLETARHDRGEWEWSSENEEYTFELEVDGNAIWLVVRPDFAGAYEWEVQGDDHDLEGKEKHLRQAQEAAIAAATGLVSPPAP